MIKRLLAVFFFLGLTLALGQSNTNRNCYTVISGAGVHFPCYILTTGLNATKQAAGTTPAPGNLDFYANNDSTFHWVTSDGVDHSFTSVPTISSQSATTVAFPGLINTGLPVITNGGTPGVTTYKYAVEFFTSDGNHTDIHAWGATTTGNATLNGTNYNVITWVTPATPAGTTLSSISVWRIVGGGSTGVIASSLSTATTTLNDTGLVGDGSSFISGSAGMLNTTGTATLQGPVKINASQPCSRSNGTNSDDCGTGLTITKQSGWNTALDVTEVDSHGKLVRFWTPGTNLATVPPQMYIDSGVGLYTGAWITLSGHSVSTSWVPATATANMLSCWADVIVCAEWRPNGAGPTNWNHSMLDNNANYVETIENDGAHFYGASGAASTTVARVNMDTSFYRVRKGVMTFGLINGNPAEVPGGVLGTGTASNTDQAGSITLSAGSGTYTFANVYTTAPTCIATDSTAVAAVKASATTTVLTLTGTATDVISYVCVAHN